MEHVENTIAEKGIIMKRGIKGLLLLLTTVLFAYSADTLWVKVTYYDFHSDRSNPEFEQPYDGKDHFLSDMVADTLDSDEKPVLGSKPFRNNYIKYWYRDWEKSGGAKGDSTIPKYIYSNFERSVILNETPNFKWFSAAPVEADITALQSKNGKYATWPLEKHYLTYQIPGTTNPTEGLGKGIDYFLEWFADIEADGDTTLDHDTSFKNVVIKDSIPFIDEDGSGHYVYKNDNFYPVDGKGFGTEWNVHDATYIQDNNQWAVPVSYLTQPDGTYSINNGFNDIAFDKVTDSDGKIHFIETYSKDTIGLQIDANSVKHNYAFTMEMDYEFVMKSGLQFKFSGDDDLWVFIDGKKVLDLGGIHSPATDSFSVDNINSSLGLNLESGKKYSLKAFYAERHSDSSHILITTNIVPVPGKVSINLDPNKALIKAGEDELTAALSIEDSDGNLVSNDNITSVTWNWGTTPNDGFFTKIGDNGKEDTLTFIKPHDAYDTITVKVSVLYKDPFAGGAVIPTPVEDEVKIIVVPGSVAGIYIEASSDMPTDLTSLRDPQEIDQVIMTANDTENSDFYAIKRDKFGNWIGVAEGLSNDDWDSEDEDLIDAQSGDASKGQGKAVKVVLGKPSDSDGVKVTADYNGFTDDIQVIVRGTTLELKGAKYLETGTPDGFVDVIEVTLTDETLDILDTSSLNIQSIIDAIDDNLEIKENLKNLTIDGFSIDGNKIVIDVSSDKTGKPVTSVDSTEKLVQPNYYELGGFASIFEQKLDIEDGLAPVIIDVIYDPNDSEFEKKKTLTIIFSEEINNPDVNDLSGELKFYDEVNNTTYTMILKEMDGVDNPDKGTTFKYEVVQINGKENPETGDKVNLLGGDVITDTDGNTQNEETKKVNLSVGDYEITVDTKIVGPLTPGDKIDNFEDIVEFLKIDEDDIGSVIKDEGTIMVISIDGVITESDKDKYEPGLVIFDNVGHVVKDGIEGVIQKDDNGKWNFVATWDGKNSKGRAVGSGSYLGQVVLKKDGVEVAGSGVTIIIGVKGIDKK